MNEAVSTSNVPTFSLKAIGLGIVICTGAVIMTLSTLQTRPANKQITDSSQHAVAVQPSRPERIWNFALGNVVVVAPELGFAVKAPGPEIVDAARVAARIEPQLLTIRNLYRNQSEKLPDLMGGVLLQVTIGAHGMVADVREIDAHLRDSNFRKAVLAEAANWRFAEVAPEGTIIDCPLLFVREGMDIGTVIRWEKNLGLFEEKKI